jgi:peroxiredoxin Q/BCP
MFRIWAVSCVIFALYCWNQTLAADQPAADAAPIAAELAMGQSVPALESVNDQGQVWRSGDYAGKRVLVLYFYPGDFTGGCIKQAEAFREGLARLEEAGVELVGVSGDQAETHRAFKESHGLKHTLLADPEGKLARSLGVPVNRGAKVRSRGTDGKPLMDDKGKSVFFERGVTLPRWTLIIGRDGKLAAKRTTVNPATEADEVLKVVRALEP